VAALGAHLDHIVGGFLVFVGDGVGANLLQFGFEPAINGVVVRGEFDDRFLPRMQERNVLRADLGFDQQGVVQRHDFHHVAARLDHAANGVDQQLVDDAAHRRGDQRPADPVFQRLAGGLGLVQVGAGFVELSQRFAAEFAARLVDLALDLLDCRFGARDGQRGGVELTTGFDLGTLEAQHLHRRYGTLRHQRLGHVDFLALQAQLLTILRLLGTEFAQFLLTLNQLFLQSTDFVMQLLTTADVQRLFAFRLTRHGFKHVLREVQRTVIDLGAQALDAQQHRQAISFGFADVGSKSRVVQANQRCAGLDDLTFLDEHFRDDPALQVLDFLDLRRRNRLAVALGHFVDHGEVGPQQQEQEEADDCPDGQAHDARGVLDQRLVDLRQRLALQRGRTLEVATDRLFDTRLKQH